MGAALDLGLAHLAPRERDLFDLLHQSVGRWTPDSSLRLTLWDHIAHPNTARALVYRTRKRLAGTGWCIQTAPGTGAYRLVRLEDGAAA